MSFLDRMLKKKAVPVVALATEVIITYSSFKELRKFSDKIVKTRISGVKVHEYAVIKTVSAFKGSEMEARAKLAPLLQKGIESKNLEQGQYDVEFFSVQGPIPPGKVWCMIAVER